jgi:hypothetical protein
MDGKATYAILTIYYMQYTSIKTLSPATFILFATLSVTLAKDIHILVSNSLSEPILTPSSTTAEVDDILIFHFPSSGTHSIVQGTFDSPCLPVDGGFYSGPINGSKDPRTTFTVRVESLDTVWFFGGEAGMCGRGMVGVVNAFVWVIFIFVVSMVG